MTASEQIVAASDESFLVQLGPTPTPDVTRRVRAVTEELLRQSPPWLFNCHPGYRSVLVEFDSLAVEADRVQAFLANLLESTITATADPERLVLVPVCYDPEFGLDLADVAAHHGLATDEVIRRHTAPDYPVHFLGFIPGFAYLGGLDPMLATARLATARPRVPAGSVGIGGEQTGVYPVSSPGGWRLIGRTPLRLFDPSADPAALLTIGDRVRFQSISRAEFDAWPTTLDANKPGDR